MLQVNERDRERDEGDQDVHVGTVLYKDGGRGQKVSNLRTIKKLSNDHKSYFKMSISLLSNA